MKLLASKTGLVALLGALLALVASVLILLGAAQWGVGLLAIAVAVAIGLLLVNHAFAVRADARTRQALQRDLRALKREVDSSAATSAVLDRKEILALTGSMKEVVARGVKPDPKEAKRIRDGAKSSLRKAVSYTHLTLPTILLV